MFIRHLSSLVIIASLLLGVATINAAVLQDIGRAVPNSDLNVKLSLNVTTNLIIVSCHVTGIIGPIDDQKVQFYCPAITSGGPCFYDCSPLCSMRSGQDCELADPVLNSSVSCAVSKPSAGAKSIDLMIDIRQAKLAGNWYCRFQAKVSGDVAISREVLGRPAGTTAASGAAGAAATTKMPARTTAAPIAVLPPPTKRPKPDSGPGVTVTSTPTSGNVGETTSHDSRLIQFARADFVFGVPALLCVSLIVNLAFCIRCCLAKYYVSLRRRKREPPGCLANCLCVSTVQVVEKDSADIRGAAGAAGEDTYEEVLPRMARHQPQRSSVRTMETTYIEAPGMHRSRTLPPVVGQTQASLYYLQGVSDSMSRILYDDVPPASSRHSSRPSSPYGQLLSGRNSHSRSSLRGAGAKQQQHATGGGVNNSANSIPAVPEEAAPFVPSGQEEEEDEGGSDYSGATRLELSRMMLRKADTLLREANSLLRDTAHGDEGSGGGSGNQLHAAD